MRAALWAFVLLVGCARPPASAPTPAPAQTIVAGTSGDYPPLSSWSGARPEGLAPTLLLAFAADTHREASFVRFRWPELANDLAAKKFDVAADGITVRPERSVAGIHTVPIARGGAVLLVRRSSWSEDLARLDRPEMTVAVNEGGHLEKLTRERFHAARIRTIAGNALRDVLVRAEADAVMTNTFEAPRLQEGLPDIVAVGPLTSDTTAFWVRADREDLATAIDDWLLAAEVSGVLPEMRTRFIGATAPTAHPRSALFAATSERLALMPFVAAVKAKEGLPIDDAAQEGRVLASVVAEVRKVAAALGRPAPPDAVVEAFFRAQFDAAKEVQRASSSAPARYSLEELRAAIGRITRRMARLVVGLAEVDEPTAQREAHEYLDGSGLSPETIARLGSVHARSSSH